MDSWKPEYPEQEPFVKLNIPNGEFEATRLNTRLYTHLGRLAIYDHVFCTKEGDVGFYIFNFANGYEQLKEYMLQTDYPAYLNQTEVAQCDVDAYDNTIQRMVGDVDHIPDEWLPET